MEVLYYCDESQGGGSGNTGEGDREPGELCQYPGEDALWYDGESDYDEDDEDEDDLDEDDSDSTAEIICTPEIEEERVIEEKLMAVPALLQNTWLRLVKKDFVMAVDEEIDLLYRLEEAGLTEIDESEEHFFLKVKQGKAGDTEYKALEHLQNGVILNLRCCLL